MQFSRLSLLAALTSLVSAQNPFNFVTLPTTIKVGTPFNITWAPSTGTSDTVTLLLRQGDPNALTNVETIASSIQNTGFYLWTPGPELVNGPLYAFEIVDDGNKFITNYSGQFAISSPNTVSSSFAAATSSLSPSQSSEIKSSNTGTTTTGIVSTTGTASTSTGTGALLSTATGTKSSSTGASTSASAATGSKTTSAGSTVPSGNAATGMKASGGLLMFVGAAMAML